MFFHSFLAGIAVSLQVLFDPRLAYVTLVGVVLYTIILLLSKVKQLTPLFIGRIVLFGFIIPIAIVVSLHAFWILPTALYRENPLQKFGTEYVSFDAVEFFSFATFPQTLSFLHPNWPENIFGKVYFMKPEFLVIPLLAFLGLLFIKRGKGKEKEGNYILSFAFVALVGSFFAKGSNPPFGELYLWMFGNIPGFMMFRDPTKWYVLIATSYTILIPYSITIFYDWLGTVTKNKKPTYRFAPKLFLIIVCGYFLWLILPALQGTIGGTLRQHQLPQEYLDLENFLRKDNDFSRTLWIPKAQRFGYYSEKHPAAFAQLFFQKTGTEDILAELKKPDTQRLLQEAAVKYLVVPYDTEGEIFLKDRKYSEEEYKKTVAALSQISWLSRVTSFGKIAIFQVAAPKGRFWLENGGEVAVVNTNNPTQYNVRIKTFGEERLVFSENFDSQWVMLVDGKKVASQMYHDRYNSFTITNAKTGNVTVVYAMQQYVEKGMIISVLSLIVVFIGILLSKSNAKHPFKR